ncbi:MAG: hypothetical protein IKM16_03135 [Clostridia bacterium]|nr:hypothetical protein [Clostridia bacterium]
MSEKAIRILAIIALVFVGIFSVSFVLYLLDKDMLGGAVALITLISGGVGFFLFLTVKFMARKQSPDEVEEGEDEKGEEVDEQTDEEKNDTQE